MKEILNSCNNILWWMLRYMGKNATSAHCILHQWILLSSCQKSWRCILYYYHVVVTQGAGRGFDPSKDLYHLRPKFLGLEWLQVCPFVESLGLLGLMPWFRPDWTPRKHGFEEGILVLAGWRESTFSLDIFQERTKTSIQVLARRYN